MGHPDLEDAKSAGTAKDKSLGDRPMMARPHAVTGGNSCYPGCYPTKFNGIFFVSSAIFIELRHLRRTIRNCIEQ